MKRTKYLVIFSVMIAMLLFTGNVYASCEYEFSGFYRERCVANSCGLFWAEPQKYYVEIWQSECPDENGEYTREGATIYGGFGNCC